MILGRIVGKATTIKFSFEVSGDAQKFGYVQVHHQDYGFVLGQITEITKEYDKTLAFSNIIGYKSEGKVLQIRTPFDIGTEVLMAEDDLIRTVIEVQGNHNAFIGKLEGKDINVYLDLQKLITKHIAVLAKSGSGKSYTVAVLIEEILEKGLPVVIIDPHGEYYSLKYPNNDEKEKLMMFNLTPKGYFKNIEEYGDQNFNANFKPLKVNSNLTGPELINIMPTKITSSQEALLYSIIKDMDVVTLEELLVQLQFTENNAKYSLMSSIDYLRGLNVFSPTPTNDLVRPGKCSIINLKGMEPLAQQIIVYKLLKDLFSQRKSNKIPPFFLVIEEAHNFVPEKTFGDAKSSNLIINIASEGRKFGLGLCVISQRPARIQKSVLSQCSTQMILKITNPNDLKAITSSVEGITHDTENEIVNLPVGTAMLTGTSDMPLFVNVRPRMTRHGGQAVNLFEEVVEKDIVEEAKSFSEQLPLIKPKTTVRDLKIMHDETVKIVTTLRPAVLISCTRKSEFNLLVDLASGQVVLDIESDSGLNILDLTTLSQEQINIMEKALHSVHFSAANLAANTGMDIMKAESLANIFVKDNLFSYNGQTYSINDHLRLISNPQDYASYDLINHEHTDFDIKLEKSYDIESIKKKLEMFMDVTDMNECYVVKYNVEQIQ